MRCRRREEYTMKLLNSLLLLSWLLLGVFSLSAAGRNLRLIEPDGVDATELHSLVATATRGCRTDREKVLALWRYITHRPYYHWCEAREEPEATTEMGVVFDPVVAFNVYGTTICYQVSHVLCNMAEAAGIEKTRVRGLPGHQVPEFFYDGAWHLFDPQYDMAAYYVADDGHTIVSLAEVCRNAEKYLLEPRFPSQPFFQFDRCGGRYWPWETRKYCAENIFVERAADDAVYYGRYIARGHTIHLDLRRGEKLVRHFGNQGKWYCTPELRARWKRDTSQRWVDQGPHDPRNPKHTYANGTLVYEPDWAADEANFYDGLHEGQGFLLEDGVVRPADGEAKVVFRVQSPYLIVGDPGRLDVAGDSRDGALFEAEFLRADESAGNAVAVSTDNGLSWQDVWRNGQIGRRRVLLDLTNHVEGRYGYLLKVTLRARRPEQAGMASLRLCNHLFYSPVPLPAVEPGPNRFAFSLDEGRQVMMIRPDLSEAQDGRRFFCELEGLEYDANFARHLSPAGAEGHAVIEVAGPPGCKVERLSVHGSFGTSSGGGDAAEILVATDRKGPWRSVWKSDFTRRNDKWRWDDSVDVQLDKPAGRCYVKFLLLRERRMALNLVRIYAHLVRPERPLPPGSVTVTHRWLADGRPRQFAIRPDLAGEAYTVTAPGEKIENRSVTIEVANEHVCIRRCTHWRAFGQRFLRTMTTR
jgi:hypothetical protein